MGLFTRRRKDADADRPEPAIATEAEVPDDVDGRPVMAPLGDPDRERIASGLAALAARGVEVDDLEAVGAAYDQAYAEVEAGHGEGAEIVEIFAIAVGEYLIRHSARGWAVVTDVFGTDLGVVSARADTAIVPHNLVSARWMRGETGWLPGVVTHLMALHPRA